jgi:hypothetical protein
MSASTLERPMAKRNDTTVKVDTEAVRIAKIAASFKDMSLAEYISELIMEHAPHDINEGHSKLSAGGKAPKSRGAK